jgi:hypothetical protein
VLPIEAWIAKEVSCTKVKLLKTASGMLKLNSWAANDGGGRIGPGGGHRESAVGTSNEATATVQTSIFGIV